VLTSDGEGITGSYRRDDFPPGALVAFGGLRRNHRGASPLHLELAEADLEPADILVAPYVRVHGTDGYVEILA